MKTSYVKVRLHLSGTVRDYAVSDLQDIGFDGFQDEAEELEAWIQFDRYNAVVRENLTKWVESHSDECRILEEETVLERNWNEEWEKTIQPIHAGPFYIHPTWINDDPPKDVIPIAIDPKMSFGTGYHETTRLMLRMIPDVIRDGDQLLDMGTGTGILAIAGLKMGAASAVGIDVDPWCYDNAIENAKINGLSHRLKIRIGSVEQLQSNEQFDLILANINRNILMELGDALLARLAPGGNLLLSGILEGEDEILLATAAFGSLERHIHVKENEWIGMGLRKINIS